MINFINTCHYIALSHKNAVKMGYEVFVGNNMTLTLSYLWFNVNTNGLAYNLLMTRSDWNYFCG